MTEEERLKRNAYMKEWRIKNKERVNKEYSNKVTRMKQNDPEAYHEFRNKKNKINNKYHDKHRDEINARAKARNWNYDKERRVEIRKRHYKKYPASSVLRQRKSIAKKKGLVFELTIAWYEKEFDKGCVMTGIPFDEHGSDTPWVAHIDRKVPELGYTPENCRLVCACYNLAKKHWTDEDVFRMAKALLSQGIL